MAIIVLSSPATLTGSEEKKTGPSRFRRYFSSVTVDDRHHGPDYSEATMCSLRNASLRPEEEYGHADPVLDATGGGAQNQVG